MFVSHVRKTFAIPYVKNDRAVKVNLRQFQTHNVILFAPVRIYLYCINNKFCVLSSNSVILLVGLARFVGHR